MAKSDSLLLLLSTIFVSTWSVSGKEKNSSSAIQDWNCCAADIRINQWPSGYTAMNIPKFTVEVVNEAWMATDGVFDVHIFCGEFASATLVNPMVFRRIGFGDCVLRDGGKIGMDEIISFDYSNILPYPLFAVHVRC
ncbi:TPD1 protein homolog 1B-like [Impatiens glandulifera]|uniref:TPD1 protein homolog 1B-like n=1 Tax=Impatiens glandulifera TaxID=253017 RepID=UPI001FB09064|nr:TPD1 protein homolog 1B-like [Impatiens glandulifera]